MFERPYVYKQHGWDNYLTLRESDVQNYRERLHSLTPQDYDGVAVLVEHKGMFLYGLASSRNIPSEDTVFILFSHSDRYLPISVSKIVAVPYMRGWGNATIVEKQDVHPYVEGNYTSDASVLEDGIHYRGVVSTRFTNDLHLVWLPITEGSLPSTEVVLVGAALPAP